MVMILVNPAWARPYLPARADRVLERLPVSLGATARELADLHRRWRAAPGDEAAALALVEREIALGRGESDPRYYGQAEGVLQILWHDRQPSARAWVLRAIVRQARHDFAAAMADLEVALATDPSSAQAWLTRAAIERVLGDYAAATRSCGHLVRLTDTLVFSTCLASVRALDGHAAAAYALLERALATTPSSPAAVQQWALTTLAEIAVSRDRADAAERDFRTALALPVRSVYLLLAYADFLLDHDRAAAVVRLLANERRVDGALLRLALAARACADPRADDYRAELAARIAAARQRGDTLHQGDAARYALAFEQNAVAALALALANWQQQREPRDARIVLEAARARGQPAAAQPVVDFLRTRGTEDVALARLLPAIGAHD